MSSPGTSLRTQRGSTLSGILVGLIIGVIIAAAVAIYINFGPKPFITKSDTTTPAKAAQSAPAQAAPASSEPIALPGKPGEQPVEKPKFDFYKILPGGEAASAPAPAPTEPAEKAPEKVYLQAGAYQNPSDADNLKARLAMMGIEANVQRIDLADKGIFYRVRLGPFGSTDDAETMRAKLATEGIESGFVRSKSQSNAQPTANGKKTVSASAPKQ